MNVEIKIGEPVNNFKNLYELVVEYEHGDADAYTHETFRFEPNNIDQLKKYLVVIKAVFDKDGATKEVKDVDGVDDTKDILSDLYKSDVVYEGTGAMLSGVELFYYDERGVKHTVEMKVNDEIL